MAHTMPGRSSESDTAAEKVRAVAEEASFPFFRDPETFAALKTKVFAKLVRDHSRHDPIRIWVLGCSTGEEAYSLAMTLTELSGEQGKTISAQVFATDLNKDAIEKARAGVYPRSIAQDVSPERLRRFFVEVEGGYQINRTIRDMCVFARQNVLADPPFSRMDLITCRNLLIYMEPVLQRRVIPLFHYALNPAGFLWLGSPETVAGLTELFDTEDAKHKFYVKKPVPTPGLGLPLAGQQTVWQPTPVGPQQQPLAELVDGMDVQREADRLTANKYAPPGVLVNAELDILQFRGDTSPYLAPAPGKPSVSLLKMAREGLLVGLRAALQQAAKEGGPVRQEGLRVKSNGGTQEVNLEVLPVRGTTSGERCMLVLFETPGPARGPEDGEQAGSGKRETRAEETPATVPERVAEAERQNTRLTQELAATREYLQSLIEQHKAANEELQSANEEVQSSNEELQSINEELQTSKEEIQSSNEALITVNGELRHRNEQLAQANSDLANFLGSTQLTLVMFGPDLRIRRFTPQAEKTLNLIAADVDRPIGDLNLPLNVPDLERGLAEVIDSVTPQEHEVQDQRGRWYSLRLRPYKTLDNKIDGAVLVLVDLDMQKRTEAALRTSEERFSELVRQVAAGIAQTDLTGRFVLVNDRYCEIVGRSREELLQLRIQDITQLEDLAKHQTLFERAATQGESYTIDKRYVRPDGSEAWANKSVSAIKDPDGKPRYIAAVVIDLTERKRSEQALREGQERLAADLANMSRLQAVSMRLVEAGDPAGLLLEIMDAAIVVTNAVMGNIQLLDPDSGRLKIVANRGFEAPFVDFFNTTQDGQAACGKALQSGERVVVEDVAASPVFAGTPALDVMLAAGVRAVQSTPLVCRSGRLVGILSTHHRAPHAPADRDFGFLDLLARQAADYIERMQTEEEIKAANRRKDEFLATLAHELRNPLAPLRHTLELLRLEKTDLEHNQLVMERQVRKLARLVDDLLDVSRINRGTFELRKEPVDLTNVARLAVESVRHQLDAQSHKLSISLPPAPVSVRGDPDRLEQIVTNLLNNATKYTDPGGQIGLTLEVQGGGPHPEAVLSVRDTGIGIAPEMLSRVFDMFVQADTSIARERGGLGIGLTLVRQLVEMHVGSVQAHSDGLGKGSEFVVRLPVLSKAKVRKDTKALRAKEPAAPHDGQARRVLVVDDNADAAKTLARLLGRLGHDVQFAHNGLAALETAAAFRPEAVLLDIGLPGMDGYEVAREIRKLPGLEHVTLAALTGYGQEEDRRRSKEAGFDTHYVKPVDLEVVRKLLAELPGK